MPWAAAAGAAISGAAGLGSAAIQSGNVSRAAGQSQRNLELMLPQMQQNYNTATGLYQPYADAGKLSLKQQQDLLGLNGPDAAAAAQAQFTTSPGYQWTVDQAMRATNASAAQGEMLHSGATLKALQDRASNLANQEFGNYYSRLAGLTQTGFGGAQGIVGAGNNLIAGESGNAQSQNQLLTSAANAQNSILGNATTGLGNSVNNLLNNQSFQNWANGLFGSSPYGPSSLNSANPTINYGGTVYGTGGQSFPSFNPAPAVPLT